ncbi:glycosyltransferase family 2 protein [Dysgonomonas sp. HGC4]|uniref:glycosyltransferase family 2 protein n=1 Tax=Dysgonomonas sp. HGC4 TaxID=1658009 RepID=UPI000682E02E|nr:glycosyltransferase family 2 protein [Dysgonomonas sp. HGC4]MBD8349735.1 glycosyltransferase [Dysgonomonas sp. HGC4]
MTISFIIPVYNTERYLDNCVSSILNQGIGEDLFEIIIVNDGSTDSSAQIITNLAKDRNTIKYIDSENLGLGAARNKGLSIAQGKYIFFVDSDDYLFDNSLPNLFGYAASVSYDIIGLDWAEVYSDGSVTRKERKSSTYNSLMSGAEYLSKFNLSGGVCPYLFSASFLKEKSILMPEGIYHEDELFLSETFTYAHQIVFVNQLVYAYYQREDSITNNKEEKQIRKRICDTIFVLDQLVSLEKRLHLNELQIKGLRRKITTLSVDFIVNLIRFRVDKEMVANKLHELRIRKLYPLPKAAYSWKYNLFLFVFNYESCIVLASKLGLFNKD